MGYESTMSLARRLLSIVRMFSRGKLPDEKSV